jgi:hypothetical protein
MAGPFTNLLRRTSASPRPARQLRRRPARLSFESLEGRRMFAATSYVDGKALIIEGTNADDVVTVTYNAGNLAVKSSSEADSGKTLEIINGEVVAIVFRGLDGKDQFVNETTIPLLAFGGRGNDIINVGDSSKATVYGEQDNDILIGNEFTNTLDGGIGNDTLMALGGDDVLFGGPNDDKLHGYEGNDIMFGGAGQDELVAGIGRDFLHGGFDYTRDSLLGNLNNSADGWRDTFVFETEASGAADIKDEDLGLFSEDDDEAVFRATGQLPGLGTSSSGYEIGDGVTFQFTAEDFGLSAIAIDWQNWIAGAENFYAEWTSTSLDEIADLDSPFAEDYLPPMLVPDADVLEEPTGGDANDEAAVVEDYFAELAADEGGLLDADEALILDDLLSESAFDDYYESLAFSPWEPTISTNAFIAPAASPTTSFKATRAYRV